MKNSILGEVNSFLFTHNDAMSHETKKHFDEKV